MFWAGTLTMLAKSEPLSYMELKSLDTEEFFIILVNYERKLNG